MKVSLKTILAITLCLATALFFGVFANADDSVSGISFQLVIGEDGATAGLIDGYDGEIPVGGILDIPDTYTDTSIGFTLPLTGIKSNAFSFDVDDPDTAKYSTDIKEIVIPASIKEIGDNAFSGLSALEKVTIKGDTVLGKNVFADCASLEIVQFGGKNVTVGEGAFSGCTNLSSITDEFGKYASDVDFIVGINAFNDTKWYNDFEIDFVTLGSTLVGYEGTDAVVNIPLNIKRIGDGAFMFNTAVKKVVFSKNVWYIGEKAFFNAKSLNNVEFSKYGEITFVGADAFTGTPYFNNYEGDFFTVGTILIKYLGDDVYVSVPNTITVISPNAFLGCFSSSSAGAPSYTISAIKIPASVKDFGENCLALNVYEDGTFYYPMIYVHNGTEAEKYVKEGKFKYTQLSIPGDLTNDGVIRAEDARLALRIAVKLDIDADPAVKYIADVDGDGSVTSEDARIILRLAVRLEDYTAEDLLYKPGTAFEILQTYTNSLNNVIKYNAGYTKTVSKELKSYDLNLNTQTYLKMNNGCNFDAADLGTSTKTYVADTKEALEAVDLCTMLSTDAIKSARCVLKDGLYTITISFKNFEDIDGTTPLTKVMPLTSRTYYDNILSNQYWFNWKYNSFTYDLIYKNAKIVAVVEADSMKLQSVVMTCDYDFANIDGVIFGINVDSSCKDGKDVGCALRNDTVKYENFIF